MTIRCHLCHGTGKVILTGEYLTTLVKLSECKEEMSGADMAKLMRTKPCAMNNRLAALEKHGLVTSRRWGRKRLFKSVKLVRG